MEGLQLRGVCRSPLTPAPHAYRRASIEAPVSRPHWHAISRGMLFRGIFWSVSTIALYALMFRLGGFSLELWIVTLILSLLVAVCFWIFALTSVSANDTRSLRIDIDGVRLPEVTTFGRLWERFVPWDRISRWAVREWRTVGRSIEGYPDLIWVECRDRSRFNISPWTFAFADGELELRTAIVHSFTRYLAPEARIPYPGGVEPLPEFMPWG